MYQCTKFDVHQAKDYQDIERSVLSYVQFDPRPLTHWTQNPFFKMYSVQSLMSVKERTLKVLSGQCNHVQFDLKIKWSSTFHDVLVYKVWSLSIKWFSRYWMVNTFLCPVWPLDLLTSKSIMVIYFSWCTSLQSLSSKGFLRYWLVNTFLCPVWPLDLLTSKSIMVIYFSWCTSLQSLQSVKQMVLKILSSQYIPLSNLTS
jgi:hypothetical protein